MMRDTDWFTTAVNEAKARVSQWPPELQQVASASLPSLEQQLAHEKHQADRIAELEREVEALRKDAARYRWLRMNRLWLKANLPMIAAPQFDAAIDAALKEQSKC